MFEFEVNYRYEIITVKYKYSKNVIYNLYLFIFINLGIVSINDFMQSKTVKSITKIIYIDN